MKTTLIAITMALSFNAFSYSVTNTIAYTLAETIYVTALTGATSEVSSNITSSKEAKQEALKLRNDIQFYFQSGSITPFLESKMTIAHSIDNSLSEEEIVDAILGSTEIILAK